MKNPQLCNTMNSFIYCSEFSLSQFIPENKKFWLNHHMNLNSVDLSNKSDDFIPEIKVEYFDGVYEIFKLIDHSKLLLNHINRENIIINHNNCDEYKSPINYEKIKVIDLINLLLTNRKHINLKIEQLHLENSHFLKEVLDRVDELDRTSSHCVKIQINEREITSDFCLSSHVIDNIINDCGLDLSNLDKFIYNKLNDFDIKLKLKENRQLIRSHKKRLNRQCDKMIQLLQKEICGKLTVIGKILDRFVKGGHIDISYDTHGFFTKYYDVKESQLEIDAHQYHEIIQLKYTQSEIEKRVISEILAITELQMTINAENIVSQDSQVPKLITSSLSPIHNSSRNSINSLDKKTVAFKCSTPAFKSSTAKNVHQSPHIPELFHEINEESFSSFDSGYLLTSYNDNQSLRDSIDNFDVIPFSDDEYEKITDNTDSDICESLCTNDGDENTGSSIGHIESQLTNIPHYQMISPINTSINHIELCVQNQICQINRDNNYLFVYSIGDHSNIFENKILLSDIDTEKMEHHIAILKANGEYERNFRIVLQMALVNTKKNPFDNIENVLNYLEQMIISLYRLSMPMELGNCITNTSVDNQYNNSACGPNIINKHDSLNEQNTNNNADSIDDDSTSELITTQEYPTNNSDSSCLDDDLRIAFKNILSDSTTSNEEKVENIEVNDPILYNDSKYGHYRDVTVNVNDSSSSGRSDSEFNDPISIYTNDLSQLEISRTNQEKMIEDIDLVIKLSELQIRSEFQSEEHNKSVMIYDKNRIVDNYKQLTSNLENVFDNNELRYTNYTNANNATTVAPSISEYNYILSDNTGKNINNIWETFPNYIFDSNDKIDEEMKTEFINNSELSEESTNNIYFVKETNVPKLKKIIHDESSLNCFDRISLTVKLTKKLLSISNYQLNFISSLFNKKSSSIKSTITHNKSLSISSLRQRLKITIKILLNLKFAIQNTYNSNVYCQRFSEIDKLIDQSQNLAQLSFDLETWMKKNGCEIDKIDCYNFEHELPDDLLIKMDPNDITLVVSMSTRRLQITIAALSQYPCYNYFMQSSLPKPDPLLNNSLTLNHNIGNYMNHWDLLQKLCKLRRVTAICALNIVDLHVLLSKLETDRLTDHREIEKEVKNLLTFWRAVDSECHRLLRCTSLVHHVMIDTRKSYINLVSLISVMQSIIRTVVLSDDEAATMNSNIDTLMNYKERILEWFTEVELCISVIYKKRMTNKRFKFYDDIHNYLEENLNTISELSDQIKKGCDQTVEIVNEVLTYCSNLPNCLISEIGKFITTDNIVNNNDLSNYEISGDQVNEHLFNAIINLENIKSHAIQFQELLCHSKNIFHIINEEDGTLMVSENYSCNPSEKSFNPFLGNENMTSSKEKIIINASTDISNRISQMAACAAINALLLFVDKTTCELPIDKALKDNTSILHNNTTLLEIGYQIVDDIILLMNESYIRNLMELKDKRSSLASEIILENIFHDVCDQTVGSLAENISMNRENVVEMLLTDTSTDITNYLCEKLGCLMVNRIISELGTIDVSTYNNTVTISTCVTKLQQQLFYNLLEKSEIIISDIVNFHFDLDKSVNISSYIVSNDNLMTGDYCKDYHSPVPTSLLKQTYDSHSVFKKSIHNFQSKSIAYTRYNNDINTLSHIGKCIVKECHISPLSKIHVLNSRYSNNKITKLVDHFNEKVKTNSSNKKLPIIKLSLERICTNMLNLKSNQIVEQLVHETINDKKIKNAVIKHSEIMDSVMDKCCTHLDSIEICLKCEELNNHEIYSLIFDSMEIVPLTNARQTVKTCPSLYNNNNNIDFNNSEVRSEYVIKIEVNETITNSNENDNQCNIINDQKVSKFTEMTNNDCISNSEYFIHNSRNDDNLFNTESLESYQINNCVPQSRNVISTNNSQFFDDKLMANSISLFDGDIIIKQYKPLEYDDDIIIEKLSTNTSEITNNNHTLNESSYPSKNILEEQIDYLINKDLTKHLNTINNSSEMNFNDPCMEITKSRNYISDDYVIDDMEQIHHNNLNSYIKDNSSSASIIDRKTKSSVDHNYLYSPIFIFLIIVLLVLAIILFNTQLYEWYSSFRITESFYPRMISNGLPF